MSLRQLVAHHADCSPSTVTNVRQEAKKRGLLTDLPLGAKPLPLPRNYSGGDLTSSGWDALYPVTDDWQTRFGDEWKVVVSDQRETAMRLLGRALRDEVERQRRVAAAQRALSKARATPPEPEA